jgi:hypothetical protein
MALSHLIVLSGATVSVCFTKKNLFTLKKLISNSYATCIKIRGNKRRQRTAH